MVEHAPFSAPLLGDGLRCQILIGPHEAVVRPCIFEEQYFPVGFDESPAKLLVRKQQQTIHQSLCQFQLSPDQLKSSDGLRVQNAQRERVDDGVEGPLAVPPNHSPPVSDICYVKLDILTWIRFIPAIGVIE